MIQTHSPLCGFVAKSIITCGSPSLRLCGAEDFGTVPQSQLPRPSSKGAAAPLSPSSTHGRAAEQRSDRGGWCSEAQPFCHKEGEKIVLITAKAVRRTLRRADSQKFPGAGLINGTTSSAPAAAVTHTRKARGRASERALFPRAKRVWKGEGGWRGGHIAPLSLSVHFCGQKTRRSARGLRPTGLHLIPALRFFQSTIHLRRNEAKLQRQK